MADARPYVVPMSLERTLERLAVLGELGMRLEVTQVDADTVQYVAQRPRGRRVLDEARGQIKRVQHDLTEVTPVISQVSALQFVLVYGLFVLLGLVLAVSLSLITTGLIADFPRRALAVLVVYGVLFFTLQPQRLLLGHAGDARFADFIQDVLSGPYADAHNLREQYFPDKRYWETRV